LLFGVWRYLFCAFILQFPVGYLSDRFDRRSIFLILLAVSGLADLLVIYFASVESSVLLYISIGLTSGIIACTYPMSISETFDKLMQHEMVLAMGCLMLEFAIGGIIGPYTTSLLMTWFGHNMLFYFIVLIQGRLAVFLIIRMGIRRALPVEDQEQFVIQGTALSSVSELDPRT
jgi:MFS family permease